MDELIFPLALTVAAIVGAWMLWGLAKRVVSLTFYAAAASAAAFGAARLFGLI